MILIDLVGHDVLAGGLDLRRLISPQASQEVLDILGGRTRRCNVNAERAQASVVLDAAPGLEAGSPG
jgi:hypothetical protein